MTFRRLIVASMTLGLAAIAVSTAPSAAPFSPIPATASTPSAVESVAWSPYCARVRRVCAARWHWGTWNFDRCVHIRGCRG